MASHPPLFAWTVLYVTDVAASLSFYENAFGLSRRFLHESGDYAELETGATTLALCSRDLAADSTGLALQPPTSPVSNITLTTADVASAYEHAVRHGAIEVHAPVTKPWGQVSSYVQDPDSHLIELASPIQN
jgi:lactoylglutathione lyase